MVSLREAAILSLFSSQSAARRKKHVKEAGTHDRKDPEERRNELLDIAIRLFLQNGYENTSVRDIFTEANGSFGMFYHHFKSKDAIFTAAMDKCARLFTESLSGILLDDHIPFEKRYGEVIQHASGLLEGFAKIRKHDRGTTGVSAFKILDLTIIDELIRPMQLFIEEGVQKGMIHTEDSHQAAVFIVYGMWGTIREKSTRISDPANVSGLIARVLNTDPALFQTEN